ncbi:MAG: hypothetical protein ACKOQR_14540 [Dolichospermum sp.]
MDDELILWNPDHLGYVDFKSESDGQLTIWETQKQEEIMNFNITTSFDTEIENLRERLAELEKKKHHISTCANEIVAQVKECVDEMKQIGVSDKNLTDWACVIYKEITGDTPTNESAIEEVRSAWEEKQNQWYKEREEIEKEWKDKYKQLLTTTNKQIDQLTTERDELLNKQGTDELFIDEPSRARADLLRKASDLTVERDKALQLVEGYKQTTLQLTIANRKLTDEVNELRDESHIILKELETQAEESEESGEDPRQNPEFLKVTKNQEIVAKFLKKLDRISHVDKLTWQRIKELPLNSETILELALQVSPKSRTHKYLLKQMPFICAKYIQETGNQSDLDWLPKDFVELVQKALLVTEETTPF